MIYFAIRIEANIYTSSTDIDMYKRFKDDDTRNEIRKGLLTYI
jgi:hypothetical protein